MNKNLTRLINRGMVVAFIFMAIFVGVLITLDGVPEEQGEPSRDTSDQPEAYNDTPQDNHSEPVFKYNSEEDKDPNPFEDYEFLVANSLTSLTQPLGQFQVAVEGFMSADQYETHKMEVYEQQIHSSAEEIMNLLDVFYILGETYDVPEENREIHEAYKTLIDSIYDSAYFTSEGLSENNRDMFSSGMYHYQQVEQDLENFWRVAEKEYGENAVWRAVE